MYRLGGLTHSGGEIKDTLEVRSAKRDASLHGEP